MPEECLNLVVESCSVCQKPVGQAPSNLKALRMARAIVSCVTGVEGRDMGILLIRSQDINSCGHPQYKHANQNRQRDK